MASYLGSHALFIVVAVATHAAVGYALGGLFDRPVAGILAAVLADVDLLVPATAGALFVHRGITHSGVAIVVAVALVAIGTRDRGLSLAVTAGYCSHLLIDATTPMGVPLASPFSSHAVGVTLGGHSPVGTVLLWTGAGLLVAATGTRSRLPDRLLDALDTG